MRTIILCTALILVSSCRTTDTPSTKGSPGPYPAEAQVEVIALSGPVASANSEISGLAWHRQTLVLVPQYPARVGNALWGIPRNRIDAALAGSAEPLAPIPIPLQAPGIDTLDGFQGYEAIAFDGDNAWVSVECERASGMHGWLIAGRMSEGALILDPATRVRLEPLAPLDNMAYETLVLSAAGPIALYEANGVASSPMGLRPSSSNLIMPRVPYRITDATSVRNDRFWVINYYWPGNDQLATPDPIGDQYGRGRTHSQSEVIERLIELQLDDDTISYTGRAPLQIALEAKGRNWEGIVRYNNDFLIITDEYPRTILARVAAPEP